VGVQVKSGNSPEGRPTLDQLRGVMTKRLALLSIRGPGDGTEAEKYASAHDLGRSCAQRLLDHGVPEKIATSVMRHADAATTRRYHAPGDVQADSLRLRTLLARSMYPGTMRR